MHDISLTGLLIGYMLLLFPVGIILWLRVPMLGTLGWALLRMTVQLLLVGLYLQFIFRLDHAAVNIAWLLIMVGVADASVLSGSGLRLPRLGVPVFVAVLVGTLLPVSVFTGGILRLPRLIEAQYLIPIAGMVLGNWLRADIIGLRTFYGTMRKQRRTCEQYLAQGGSLHEMARTVILIAKDTTVVGRIGVADPIKPTSAEAVHRLHDLGEAQRRRERVPTIGWRFARWKWCGQSTCGNDHLQLAPGMECIAQRLEMIHLNFSPLSTDCQQLEQGDVTGGEARFVRAQHSLHPRQEFVAKHLNIEQRGIETRV
jgi:ABC-type iron transport system FetAB permease component